MSEMQIRQPTRDLLDVGGMWVSSVCAVHCALMPLVLPLLPLIGLGSMLSESVEMILISSALTLALVSLFLGLRVHGSPQAVLLAVVGISLIALAHTSILPGEVHTKVLSWHTLALTLGGSLVALAHWRNKRLCHCAHC